MRFLIDLRLLQRRHLPHSPTDEFSKASGNLLRGSQNGRTESPWFLNFPSGHAMSSHRLFLSGLLSSRARLRLAGLTIFVNPNHRAPPISNPQTDCLTS